MSPPRLQVVAAIARIAWKRGDSMADAVAERFGVCRESGTRLLAQAREAGYEVPRKTDRPASDIPTGHALTLDDHRRLTSTLNRPLTWAPGRRAGTRAPDLGGAT